MTCQDRNHFGPAPNQLMSDSWNMSTHLSVFKNGRDDPSFKKISQTALIVEMDLRLVTQQFYIINLKNILFYYIYKPNIFYIYLLYSNIGSNEHRTREGYKNKQKREAFEFIENLADNLNIHESVRAKAKQEYVKINYFIKNV